MRTRRVWLWAALAVAVAASWLLGRAGQRALPGEQPAVMAPTAQEVWEQRPARRRPLAMSEQAPLPTARSVQEAKRPAAWTAAWGAGPGQLGRERQAEGNAEGPMSLAVGPAGEAWVVDTVNGRLQRFLPDGGAGTAQPLAVQYAQDLVVLPDGRTLQLDRLVDKSVAVVGADGRVAGELPLVGPSLKESGGVTGLFVDGEDVYVEREHGALVRVGDTAGRKDEAQPEVPGRPSRDGSAWLSAGIVDGAAGRLFVTSIQRSPLAQRFTRELRVPPAVTRLLLLDSDASGVIYLALLSDGGGGEVGGSGEQVTLLCLDGRDGRVLGQQQLPPSTIPEESFRDFAVDPLRGGVLYAWRTDEGVRLVPTDCRSP